MYHEYRMKVQNKGISLMFGESNTKFSVNFRDKISLVSNNCIKLTGFNFRALTQCKVCCWVHKLV